MMSSKKVGSKKSNSSASAKSGRRPSSLAALLRDTPRALAPKYVTAEPNDTVVLYEGPLVLSERGPHKRKHLLDGRVYLRWAPDPMVEFEATGTRSAAFFREGDVALPKLRWQVPFFSTKRSTDLASGTACETIRGCITGTFQGFYPRTRVRAVSEILFHVANAQWLHGAPVAEERTMRTDRLQYEAAEWRVTLDAIADHTKNFDKLKEHGGYMFTYVGRVERLDGASFAPEAAKGILDTVGWFLSLLWGSWTGPALLVGRRNKSPVWEQWSLPNVDSWSPPQPWAPRGDPRDLGQLFRGLYTKLNDPIWERTVRYGIHWYVAALNQAGAIEGAIMMSQAAFELLWWTEFVGSASAVHEPDKLIAADKLRLLLHRHKIPLAIPPELSEMTKEARSKGWEDGPQALTQVRNETVHPAKGRKARVPLHGPPVWEAWRLSVWYLEMCLLAVLDYNGAYCPRIPSGGNANDTKKVPWA